MIKWLREAISNRYEKQNIHGTKNTDNMDKLRELTKTFNKHTEIISNVYRALLFSNDACYISDINTYEILWTNHAVVKLHGPGLVGKKCYEAFHAFSAPCDFCTNKFLDSRNTYTWVFFNEKLQRNFLIRDRAIEWGDQVVRLETAIDITELNITDGGIS